MELNYKTLQKTTYIILIALFIFIIFYCFTFNSSIVKHLSFRQKINLNSNDAKNLKNPNSKLVEGFSLGGSRIKKNDDIFTLIDRKLKGLTEELGGSSGKREVKEILKKTKEISDLECAKCMMMMMEDHKGVKAMDLDKLAEDDSSEMCIKCKNYTALSTSIKNMIDNL
tara:strand:+ start:489 stop:995 length:507 start_codon:yes stop_codon:yes gene_type:complete